MANKFFARKVWIVPGNEHLFRSEHDAKYYCQQNGIDFSTVERYDSTKEYYRWLELLGWEKQGKISDLKRQVEFELTPKQYERVKVRDKQVKSYIVPNEGIPYDSYFSTKKEAVTYAKSINIPNKAIKTITATVPVYKDVTILDKSVYTADFTYIENGELVVEDVKSEYTRKEADYVLRKKFLYDRYQILIRET